MDDSPYMQLHKLSSLRSEETLETIFETLWSTRKTGLKPSEKPYFQSLLGLPTLEELDPVLACLRSLIRRCVNENFTRDDLQKLFPLDLPLELQSMLVMVLQKYQNQWKDAASGDQPPWHKTRVSYQVKVNAPPGLTPFTSSETLPPMWPRQDDASCHFNRNDLGGPTSTVADISLPRLAPMTLQRDDGPLENLVNLPHLKSMTWTLENRNSTPANRVAIISLKLQDYSKSTIGETEVKFQLSRDTLDAMLRSMAYISEQLSNVVGPSSGPLQKKQRQ